MEAKQQLERYHALDAMRASMMLLGVYLHIVVGYSGDGSWPYKDPHPTHALTFTLGIIHCFRMPAFFAMAGFFGALLWNGRGPAAFIQNRVRRILAPFALFWSLLFLLMSWMVVRLERGPGHYLEAWTSGALLKRLHPLHLWFLEYLLLLYALGALVAWALRHWPATRVHSTYRWMLSHRHAPSLFALFSWLPLAAMHGNLKDCDGFVPELPILAAYIPPFAFGWLLYHQRDLLPRFERNIWPHLILAIPAFVVYGKVSGAAHPFLRAAGNVIFCWLMIFAVTGLFLKLCSHPSPRWRYLSDSSYWIFILHMPVVVGLQVALMPVALPALAKIPLVLAIAVLLLVISYDVAVRPTWIGALLNGRRYARGLPRVSQ